MRFRNPYRAIPYSVEQSHFVFELFHVSQPYRAIPPKWPNRTIFAWYQVSCIACQAVFRKYQSRFSATLSSLNYRHYGAGCNNFSCCCDLAFARIRWSPIDPIVCFARSPEKIVDCFFELAWEVRIENVKWRVFCVFFVFFWSLFPTILGTKIPQKNSGKFGENFRARFRTKIRINSGNIPSAIVLTQQLPPTQLQKVATTSKINNTCDMSHLLNYVNHFLTGGREANDGGSNVIHRHHPTPKNTLLGVGGV